MPDFSTVCASARWPRMGYEGGRQRMVSTFNGDLNLSKGLKAAQELVVCL